ncbi:MAG TPA: type I-C CRISPR-associated protein Cas8c/Csd1 [Candidatus Paceibacterota bacterium]|nr:type I-C CRISPR-associated protein Cas8c/Csd1 [Candidatus Paceibacterota bacterium]HRZ56164.1 type I-C CRISPR-associated protein Cas8c/Csd1 [Candidatus Paceibacterota bacterium]
MLLKLLYDFAESRRLLDHLAFKRKTPVRWIIELDEEGKLLGVGPRETQGSERNKGKEYDVPKTSRATGSGQVADFLVDDIGAIFGLNTKPDQELKPRAITNLRAKHEDFWRQIKEAHAVTGKPTFHALLRFRESLAGAQPSFLRLDSSGSPKWIIRRASDDEVRLGNDLFTFDVGGILIDDEAVCQYWRQVHGKEMTQAEEAAQMGVCLITGETGVPIARTHTPMVTGLPKPAKGTGAGIVGADKAAFWSYGLQKAAIEEAGEEPGGGRDKNPGYLSPCSIRASKGYLLALQHLSSHDDHWLALGPAWLCFWAAETEKASGLFAQLLRRPDTLTIRRFMTSPWSGLEKPPPDTEKFNVVTLTAAGPRIVVKDWLQVSLGEAVVNFKAWFGDMEIQPINWGNVEDDDDRAPLSVRRLAHATLRPDSRGRFDEDKLKPDLMASLYRAALSGSAPSITLLKPLLERLQANIAKTGTKALYDQSRFALLRLIVNRHHRNRNEQNMQIQAKLPAKTDDTAYNCGCLLSVLNSLQRSAHDGKLQGASIAERYYGSASTNPSAAFSILWRLHQHHLKKLRQKGEKGQRAAHRIKESITGICSQFAPPKPCQPPQMPRVFTLVEQARFALGFYQQEAARAEAVRLWKEKQLAAGKPAAEEEAPEEELFADNQV